MEKIYEHFSDVHVVARKVYPKESSLYAFADADKTQKISASDLEDLFLKGCVIVDDDIEYKPVSCKVEDGLATLTYVKADATTAMLAALTCKEYVKLVVAGEAATTSLLGKTGADLQENIAIADGVISGTLKYVTGYTGFSGNVEYQSGNYIALTVETSLDGPTTVELIGGTVGHPIELDEDMNIILRITNTATQSVKVVTSEGEISKTLTYALTGLTLASAE